MNNGMVDLLTAYQNMMLTNVGLFLPEGRGMVASMIAVVMVLYGMQMLDTERDGMHGFKMLIVKCVLATTMATYYMTPIPGVGMSFTQMLILPSQHYTAQIANTTADDLMRTLNQVGSRLNAPWWNPFAGISFRYLFAYISAAAMIWVFQGAIHFVIGLGYYAVSIGLTFGPIAVGFFLVPGFDWVFWSWIRALFAFSFYQVFAHLFLNSYANLVLNYIGSHPLDLDPISLVADIGGWVILLLSGAGTILAIPLIAAAYFTGGSGSSSFLNFWGMLKK